MSNNRWLNWVQDEVHQKPEQRPLNKRIPSSTTVAATTPTSSSSTTTTNAPISTVSNPNNRFITPTKEQLDVILPNPVQCFCEKPAHRTFTSEYGPILVCNNFELDPATTPHKTQSKFVCGFHVHETSWTKFCDAIKGKNHVSVDYVELRSCPLYNFTFCTIFRISNKYDMNPPIILPNCFCHKPVTMRISRVDSSISFACKNGDVDGARKCSWVLPAHQVAFPRPTFHIHNTITHEDYMNKKHETLTAKKATPTPTPSPNPPISGPPAPPAEGHQADLLATLSRTSSKNKSPDIPPLSELNPKQPKPTGMKSLIIPTCVMGKRPNPQPVLSTSSSASSCSLAASPVISSSDATIVPNTKTEEQQQNSDHEKNVLLKSELNLLRNENSHLKSTINTLTANLESLASKSDRLKTKTSDLQIELHRSKNEYSEQNILRINCQERLSKIELDVVHLMNDNEKLKEELHVIEDEMAKSGKDEEVNKCRLCFTRNIEFCLIPCYHYGMQLIYV